MGGVQAQGEVYLFQEGFESETFPPTGWTQEKISTEGVGADKYWVRNISPNNVHTGTASAQLEDMPSGNVNNLISPAINIPAPNAYEVSFWIYRVDSDKPNEGVKLWVSNTTGTAGGTMLLVSRP